MPTNDASAPRPARRSLGRGPGAAPQTPTPAAAVPGPGGEAPEPGYEPGYEPGPPSVEEAAGDAPGQHGDDDAGPASGGDAAADSREEPGGEESASEELPTEEPPAEGDASAPRAEGQASAAVAAEPIADPPVPAADPTVHVADPPVHVGAQEPIADDAPPEGTSGDGAGAPPAGDPVSADTDTAPSAETESAEDAGPGAPEPSAADVPAVPPQVDAQPGTGAARSAGDAQAGGGEEATGRFTVRLANFQGPFDLLLQLISRHKLDVTEVALSKVTDEFMAHIRAMGADWDLDQTTEFLVVAATLLDLKAARLLPAAEVEDEADLALLEARDLLFARLLQYRAYKQIADIFSDRLAAESRLHPRTVGLEPHHAELLPEVVISIGPEGFAKLAVKAMQPKAKPQVYVDHIHAPLVSVREQAEVVVARLREAGESSFLALIEDAPDTLTVVARFLALLELYRERAVVLDQEEALGSLMVRWTGGEDGPDPVVTDEFDQAPGERAAEKEKENA
ncbi:segregation/condensation protein A [Streptomyces sp. NPDC047108]|uniref:segregation/condensation protein A n=1 Tax=Streptomyces sp. NPDC047108 TaxID=3155025 RepID=UPI0033F08C42